MKKKNNKKYFVVSDIHGFYLEFHSALIQAGWQRNNRNHILVVLGDIFDRGTENWLVYKFIRSIPKTRRILIRGNHEGLLLRAIDKKKVSEVDYYNGTAAAILELACEGSYEKMSALYKSCYQSKTDNKRIDLNDFSTASPHTLACSKPIMKEICDWIKSDEWKEFYEIDKFIFVHCFIPINVTYPSGVYGLTLEGYKEFCKPIKDWRKSADEAEWYDAKWGCPYKEFSAGLFDEELENGKVLVCGHWSACDFHRFFDHENEQNDSIYFSKNLIALDGRTAASHQVNVLVIDEEYNCYDKEGNKLESK